MRPLRVVLADDDYPARRNIKAMLTELGHHVVGESGNGARALELVRKLRPDLALLDVKTAKMDGIKAAKLITGQKLCAVLMLTAYNGEETVNRALDAGVMGYLTKPVTRQQLEPALRIAWARHWELMTLKYEKARLNETLSRDIRRERLKNACQGVKDQEPGVRMREPAKTWTF